MKTILRSIAVLSLGVCLVQADERALPPTKRTSNFKMDAGGRNPFWPIGWRPVAGEEAGPEIPPTAFVVTSITLDPNAHFAIINGKTMTEGQQFGLQMGSQTYQLTLKAIEDGRVILLRRNEEIIVPLRRK